MATRCVGLAVLLIASACSDPIDEGPIGGSRAVSGQVVDFQTATPVAGAASVSTSGLNPAPMISTHGATFTLAGVPNNSTFEILASAPAYRQTYSPIVIVTDDQIGVDAPTVSESFLAGLASGFGITPSAANGVLFMRVVDGNGAPRANIAGTNLVLGTSANGPHFLDANLAPAPSATATSASGWAVFFELAPGDVSLGQAANATVTLAMATSPVSAGAITLADVTTTDGTPPALPTNVSFTSQVYPIFSRRGCVACHTGGGIGKDLGGLMLDGGRNLAYRELVTETPTRVVVGAPETSRVLTMPSRETPPDAHPNITFTGPQDPDYLTILVWIREGAKDN
jgi:mono/diheme cytochrome c family protein